MQDVLINILMRSDQESFEDFRSNLLESDCGARPGKYRSQRSRPALMGVLRVERNPRYLCVGRKSIQKGLGYAVIPEGATR